MGVDLKELARSDMRGAMGQEILRNQCLIDGLVVNRRSPRAIKEALLYAMARNNAIYHFLALSDPSPKNLYYDVPINEDYRNLMYKIGAKRYPLEIKRKAEWDLFRDYTHDDYKKQSHFLDQPLPEKPNSSVLAENVGRILGLTIKTGFQFWWVFLLVIFGWVVYTSPSQSNYYSKSSSGQNNTFNSGGIPGGNSTSKPVSDTLQVKDGSGESGFGNGGMSGYDAPTEEIANPSSSNYNRKAAAPINNVTPSETVEKSSISQSSPAEPVKIPTALEEDEKFEVKQGYFTLGSTIDDVISVMGEPERKSGTSFSYGSSLVFFRKDKVSGWAKIDRDLKVSIGNKKEGSPLFTIGSSKKQVIQTMGTPSSANDNSFQYGYSLVFFDAKGNITGWSKIGGSQFNVTLGEKVKGAEPFAVGSTIEDVIAVMGTPDSYSSLSLGYGYSQVFIQNGKVSSYSDISKNLKVK